MTGVYLSHGERLDMKGVLRMAEHALTYPMLMPGDEGTVRAIRECIDFLTTDDERTRVAEMKARLAAIRAERSNA